MTNHRKTLIGALTIGFLVLMGAGPAPDAGAQTEPTVLGTSYTAQADPSPPPTTPCEGCGPSGSTVPGADRAYAWSDHHCLPDGTSAYSVTFGLGRNATSPATFYARFTNGPLPDKVLGTLTAGQERTVYPLVIVGPGETVLIDVVAYSNGTAVKFGNGANMRVFVLTCPCEQPPTTVTTSPPSSAPPATPGTTAPGVTAPPSPTTPGAPPTVAFELPATGTWTAWLVLIAALLAFFGFCAKLLGRKGPEVDG